MKWRARIKPHPAPNRYTIVHRTISYLRQRSKIRVNSFPPPIHRSAFQIVWKQNAIHLLIGAAQSASNGPRCPPQSLRQQRRRRPKSRRSLAGEGQSDAVTHDPNPGRCHTELTTNKSYLEVVLVNQSTVGSSPPRMAARRRSICHDDRIPASFPLYANFFASQGRPMNPWDAPRQDVAATPFFNSYGPGQLGSDGDAFLSLGDAAWVVWAKERKKRRVPGSYGRVTNVGEGWGCSPRLLRGAKPCNPRICWCMDGDDKRDRPVSHQRVALGVMVWLTAGTHVAESRQRAMERFWLGQHEEITPNGPNLTPQAHLGTSFTFLFLFFYSLFSYFWI
jgi:hypothetical protein